MGGPATSFDLNPILQAIRGRNPGLHRIDDDASTRANTEIATEPTGEEFADQAGAMARVGRMNLAAEMRQQAEAQPSPVDDLRKQYNEVGQQIAAGPPKRSLWKDILGGALAGPRAEEAIATRQRGQEFQQNQLRERQNTLLQNIEAERRMQEQEETATNRMTLQQEMENQREREREGAQANLFKQQQTLEDQREAQRGRLQSDLFKQQAEQQGRQFGEQEKLQGMRDAAADRRAERTADRADISKREKVLTYWQPSLDSAERANIMAKNYEEGVNNHNQQAMLSLLTNHLGMTMGVQKNARITQAVLEEAQKSQPWLQGIKSKIDKDGFLSGVTLSPQQMKQMLDLGFQRYREDVKKSRSMSGYIGVKDEPDRQISDEAVGYYLDAAGNDANRARAMAKQDGWTF